MTRVGDFGNQAVVGAFDFHLADLDENLEIHGLGQRAIWPYGGLRSESGDLYVFERKLVHQMTGGLWLMSDTQRQVAWNVFSNHYDDGTHEWGHIVRGTGGIGACMVAGDTAEIAATSDFGSTFTLDDQDYVSAARYAAGGHEWEFTADPAGRMVHFNKARWAGYRAQSGLMRRVGDNRTVTNGLVWLGCFADRI